MPRLVKMFLMFLGDLQAREMRLGAVEGGALSWVDRTPTLRFKGSVAGDSASLILLSYQGECECDQRTRIRRDAARLHP
jgi:hypothetical protein